MNGNACPAALRSLPANAGICQIIDRQPVCEADSFIGDRKRIQMVVPDEHSLRAAETDGRIKQGAGMIGTGNLFIGFSDGTVKIGDIRASGAVQVISGLKFLKRYVEKEE
ncbi:MAG: hypothetical protein MR018_02635 [Clostridiales bacterium]|mgnify:FL=1|nr:hypothetical protein [Clostridiales bacterium]MDD7310223.1 hypothetical protein [Eubacteriales bacterium]MDY5346516.1 hypothetical protein [Eubacteriales bacterium]